MKRLERFELIDKVARELQARMTYADIKVYLRSFKVDVKKVTSATNSKWVFVKELLADEDDELVLTIAADLNLISYDKKQAFAQEESRFWRPSNFRLFISHISSQKVRAALLKEALQRYAISGFVAHEDINPSLEWQIEIERALASMDALAAVLTTGFKESDWTDQEVGFALGRQVTVIPLIDDLHPYGFLGKIQGVKTKGKTVGQVAESLFKAIAVNDLTRNKMGTILVEQILGAQRVQIAESYLAHLSQMTLLNNELWEQLRDSVQGNAKLSKNESFVQMLNLELTRRKLSEFASMKDKSLDFDDDIPF